MFELDNEITSQLMQAAGITDKKLSDTHRIAIYEARLYEGDTEEFIGKEFIIYPKEQGIEGGKKGYIGVGQSKIYLNIGGVTYLPDRQVSEVNRYEELYKEAAGTISWNVGLARDSSITKPLERILRDETRELLGQVPNRFDKVSQAAVKSAFQGTSEFVQSLVTRLNGRE
jgi:hypothetical protein